MSSGDVAAGHGVPGNTVAVGGKGSLLLTGFWRGAGGRSYLRSYEEKVGPGPWLPMLLLRLAHLTQQTRTQPLEPAARASLWLASAGCHPCIWFASFVLPRGLDVREVCNTVILVF